MVWDQQEIGAHTGDEEENLPLSPPPPPPPRWRMFLAYKLVPDRSREYEYNLIIKNNFIIDIFFAKLYFVKLTMKLNNIILNKQTQRICC